MRGDRPGSKKSVEKSGRFTPHARGSTVDSKTKGRACPVYPACAGIDLGSANNSNSAQSLPRMRGDRPPHFFPHKYVKRFTPHARGSTEGTNTYLQSGDVYPACAGIDLQRLESLAATLGLPRMRGDRPGFCFFFNLPVLFTPHARGSTLLARTSALFSPVYPACAGIDPIKLTEKACAIGLPRMRGDRPQILFSRSWIRRFTPHARGSTRSQPMPE